MKQQWILSSSESSVGVGNMMVFQDKDVKDARGTGDGFEVETHMGNIYRGYDLIKLDGDVITYIQQI